jgi:uracil-DNA glycosylase
MTLEQIHEQQLSCQKCGLRAGCRQVVPGNGVSRHGLMIVGEASGLDEDIEGEPFVGRSGQHLNNLLKQAGFERGNIYVTNTVCCRPPNNRTPTKEEIDNCKQWLWKKILAIEPKIILTLGKVPTGLLLRKKTFSITSLVYKYYKVDYTDAQIAVCYHPSYLLRRNGKLDKETVEFLKGLYVQIY